MALLRLLYGGGFFDWFLSFPPGGIGVVVLHGFTCVFGLLAEVLLIHNSIFVDDERHHAGVAIFRRIGDERESSGHFPAYDVVGGPTGRGLALARYDAEVVSVEWRGRSVQGFRGSVWNAGCGDQRPNRALRLLIGTRPVQPVLFSLIAREFLGVLFVLFREVFV